MIDLRNVLEDNFFYVWRFWFADRVFYKTNKEEVSLKKQMISALTKSVVSDSQINWRGYNRREDLFV